MAKNLIAVDITETFRLRSGITGETFSVTYATKPGGTWAGPDIAEVGSGEYELTFTPDTVGVWLATITGDTSGETFNGVWQVVDSPTPTFSRRTTGNVIASSDINSLQAGLEKVQKVLGIT